MSLIKTWPLDVRNNVYSSPIKKNGGLVIVYRSGHEGVALLLPSFDIKWQQNQVTKQLYLYDLTHVALEILLNLGPSNGLLNDGIRPLPATNVGAFINTVQLTNCGLMMT